MRIPRLSTAERRIGLIGLYAAGNTVLLTSLVDHRVKGLFEQMVEGRTDGIDGDRRGLAATPEQT